MLDDLKGITEPRVYTKELRPLTPETSLGFACIEFSRDILQVELLPWQQFLVIHALEIVGDLQTEWHFRFRTVLVIVARQQGKTMLGKVLAAFFLWVLGVPLVLGTSTDLSNAEEVWEGVCDMAEESPELSQDIVRIYKSAGNKTLTLTGGRRYKVSTTNRRGARGKSGDLVLLDELREHQTWEAWAAISKTTIARPNALIWCMSNAGDASSIVLRTLRARAHIKAGDPDHIEKAEAMLLLDADDEAAKDETLGLFEWSAAPDLEPSDPKAWQQANPSLGYGFVTARSLQSARATDPENKFRTECLCQWIQSKARPPYAAGVWDAGIDPHSYIAADAVVYYGIDVAADRTYTSIAAVGLRPDGAYHGEIIAYKKGVTWIQEALARLVDKAPADTIKVAVQGRGAAVSSLVDAIAAVEGVDVIEGTGARLVAWCGRFDDAVNALHPDETKRSDTAPLYHIPQPRLDTVVELAQRKKTGDGTYLWDRLKSDEDISPLMALTVAYGAATDIEQDNTPVSAYADRGMLIL